MAIQPACPVCKTVDEGHGDALGVHLCRRCRIEFRPPDRVPIPGVRVPKVDAIARSGKYDNMWAMLVFTAIAVGVVVGLANGGPSSPPTPVPSYTPPQIELEIPELPTLEFSPLEALPTLERRGQFDARGHPLDERDELQFEPELGRVKLSLEPDMLVLDGRVTIVGRDQDGQLVDTVETPADGAWSGELKLFVTLPRVPCASYEVRVGGTVVRTVNPS